MINSEVDKITAVIVDCCIKIHKAIGPGCFEKVYEELLCYELLKKGLEVERQLLLPIRYMELFIENAYKVDMLVEKKIVLEIKSVSEMLPVHFKQLTTYLKLMELKNGMLLNFKVDLMRDGIHRVFNNNGR